MEKYPVYNTSFCKFRSCLIHPICRGSSYLLDILLIFRRKLLLLDADLFSMQEFKDVRLACLFDLSFMSACNSRLEFLFYWAQDCFAECGTITYSTHGFFRPICNTWIINTGGGKHTQTFLLLSVLVHILPKLSNQERESKTQATSCSLSLQTSVYHRLNELY